MKLNIKCLRAGPIEAIRLPSEMTANPTFRRWKASAPLKLGRDCPWPISNDAAGWSHQPSVGSKMIRKRTRRCWHYSATRWRWASICGAEFSEQQRGRTR